MHPLASTFDAGRQLLARNPSVAALADDTIPTSAKLAVVPTMAFWVLGFADAMALLRGTCGDTQLDHVVRQHAEEDSEHWRWFVADLELLATQGVGARSMSDAMLRQWGPTNEPVRACAWTLHHLLRTHTNPVARLALLEACEDGFEAFMNCIRPVVRAANRYGELRYLGAIHDHAESNHTLHEMDDPFETVDWSAQDVTGIRRSVEQMYARIDGMHSCYAVAISSACATQPVG